MRRSRGSEPAVLAYVPHDTSQPVSKRSFPFWRERERVRERKKNLLCRMNDDAAVRWDTAVLIF